MTTDDDTLAQLMPITEQRQIVLRSVLLDLVRVHACCSCPGCVWAVDLTITHARAKGASDDDIRDAYRRGRREQE